MVMKTNSRNFFEDYINFSKKKSPLRVSGRVMQGHIGAITAETLQRPEYCETELVQKFVFS